MTFTAADDRTCTAVYAPITTRYNSFDTELAAGGCARVGGAVDTWIRLN